MFKIGDKVRLSKEINEKDIIGVVVKETTSYFPFSVSNPPFRTYQVFWETTQQTAYNVLPKHLERID